jgi:hypothetical protein
MHECHSISAASLTDPCSKLAASQAEVILPYWSCMLSWPEYKFDAALHLSLLTTLSNLDN